MQPPPVWARPSFVWSTIIFYLLAHFAIRMMMGPALSVDDSEQAYFSQSYAWAYRYKAPPLFTWLLVTLGQVIPVGVVAIGLVRYALLGLTYGFVYLTARRLIADPRLSALSVYSFAAINPLAEASHRNLTHSTALTAVAAIAWYIFVRLAATRHLGWYLALGAAFGLGMLAKWNFVILALALPLSCLLSRGGRPLIFTWKVVPAALVATAIVLPTFIATLKIRPPADDLVATVLDTTERSLGQVLTGTLNLLDATIIYALPFLPIALILFGIPLWRGLRAGSGQTALKATRIDTALIGLTMAVGLALLWIFVLAGGATKFSVRYLFPVLLILPVWLFMQVERGRPVGRSLNVFVFVLAALAVFVAAKRVARVTGVAHCGLCPEWRPFGPVADQLADAGYMGLGTILADIENGGNLRPLFPRTRVIDPIYPPTNLSTPAGEGQCLIIWLDDGEASTREAASRHFEAHLAGTLHGDPDAPRREGALSAQMLEPAEGVLRLGYRLYDEPNGDCR
jgi:4-amino-4-deoxy-L-arabinose transferase-like glycosyltransferase